MKWCLYMTKNLNDLHETYLKDPLMVDEFASELTSFVTKIVKLECKRRTAATFDLVEDAIGEALLGVWGGLGEFDATKSKFTTWVTTITLRRIVDIFRKSNKRQEIGLIENWDGGVKLRIGDRVDCAKLLARLDEEDRSFIIKKFQGLTGQELADHFGQNLQWTKNKWSRLAEKLKLLAISNE